MSASRTLLNKLRTNPRTSRPHGASRKVIGQKGERGSRLLDVSNRVSPGIYPLTYAELGLEARLHVTKGLRVEVAK